MSKCVLLGRKRAGTCTSTDALLILQKNCFSKGVGSGLLIGRVDECVDGGILIGAILT